MGKHSRLTRIVAAGALLVATAGSFLATVDSVRAGAPITYNLSANTTTLQPGLSVTFATNAPGSNTAAFFVDEVFWGRGAVERTPNPFSWCYFGGATDVTGTYRIYPPSFSGTPTWSTPYAATLDVTFKGGDFDCYQLEADKDEVDSDETVIFSSTAIPSTLAALFFGEEKVDVFPVGAFLGEPIPWCAFGGLDDVEVTIRLYKESGDPDFADNLDFRTESAASVTVTFTGDSDFYSLCDVPFPYELTADKETVEPGGSVTFETNARSDQLAAFFVDEKFWDSGRVGDTPNPFSWCFFGGATTVKGTYRIYGLEFDPDENGVDGIDWEDPYAATIDVTFTGGDYDCQGGDGGGGDRTPWFDIDLDHYLRRVAEVSALPETL